MFVDSVDLQLLAGKGGNGVIAWRREKYIPKGGPTGGNGGRGGSILFEADSQIYSLEHLRNRRIIKAENGRPGEGNRRAGRSGKDLHIKVPLGTLLKDKETGVILFDFVKEGDRYEICKGGKGGRGNSTFKSSTHQAPYVCTEGTPGETADVALELKLIADIGLVGMPNAGKSTLISRLAQVPVKIAPYPFTTLVPNLGVMKFDEDYSKVLIADIPGIIEKASSNRGLGFSFLKHVERTTSLLFVIELAPFESKDPFQEFLLLQKELEIYNPALLKKPYLVVLNKIDQEGATDLAQEFRTKYTGDPARLFEISAKEGWHLQELKNAIGIIVKKDLLQSAS